jgi:hypothetical protein
MAVEVLNEKLKGPFPKLMISNRGAVVLMHNAKGEGTLLKAFNDGGLKDAEMYKTGLDLNKFDDYLGKITLSNAG